MGKMKRFFSLMLVLTIVLGSFGSVFAAEEVKTAADEELKKVPTDVIGTEYEKAVARLVAFGVLDGYKDGTYRPDQDVTRAEFAKILVEALGIGNAAKAAAGKVTFKDVPASHWASGYVSTASGYGLLKGFPDGTFKPEQQVSYADALTMLVRALGYQDSFLKGAWPGSHIAKAAEAGITSGVNFADARGFANRGKVAQIVNNTLDCDVVKVETYKDGTVEYKETEKTLLKDKLDISKYEDTRVIADKIVNDGLEEDEITVKFLKEIKKDDESVKRSYDEGEEKDFTIKKGLSTRQLIGEEVSVYMNDKDVVVYVESEKDDKAYFDTIEKIEKGKDGEIEEIGLVRFDKEYKFDKEAKVYVYDSKDKQYNELDAKDGYIKADVKDIAGKVGKFVVKNNRIIYAEIMDPAEANPWMLVRKNDKGLLEGINDTMEDFDIDLKKDGDYDGVLVFDTLGNKLDVEDIEEGNIIYVQKLDYDGDDYAHVVVVQDNIVEGKLSKVKEDRITLGDKQLKAIRYKDTVGGKWKYQNTYYSVEGFEDIKKWPNADEDAQDWENDMEDADGEDMVAYLDATGKVAFLSTEGVTGGAGYKYGVVTRTYVDHDRIKIYTYVGEKDGEEITYKVEKERDLKDVLYLDEYGNHKDAVKSGIEVKQGHVVKFKLNKDGEIADGEFYAMNPKNAWKMQTKKDFGKDSIPSKLGDESKSFYVEDKAVIIDAESLIYTNRDKVEINEEKFDSDDFGIVKWSDIAEDNNDENLEYFVFTKRTNNVDVEAVVFVGENGLSTASDEEAIYVIDKDSRGGDVYVKYMSYEDGKVVERQVDKVDKKGSVRLGEVGKERPYIAKMKSGNKIDLYSKSTEEYEYVTGVVSKRDGNIVTLKDAQPLKYSDKELRLSSGVVVYDEDVKKTTSNIRVKDEVTFIVEDKVNVRVVSIGDQVKDSTGGGSDKDETKKGNVSMVNADEGLIEVDGKVLELDKRVKLVNEKGTTLAIGPTSAAKMLSVGDDVRVTEKDGIVTEIKLLSTNAELIVGNALNKVEDSYTVDFADKDNIISIVKADIQTAIDNDNITVDVEPASGENKYTVTLKYVLKDEDGKVIETETKSKEITIKVAEASKDATLKEIKVAGVKLDGFKADVVEYGIELPEGTTVAPKVTAVASHSEAKVEITQADLEEGKGTAIIKVTAEDGTSKEYKINFTVEAEGETPTQTPQQKFEADLEAATNGGTIILTGNVAKSDVNLTTLTNLDLAGHTLTGNVTITSEANGTLDIKSGTIVGDLTVNAKNATVNNTTKVNETIIIEDVSSSTWNEKVSGNKLVFEAAGKTLKIADDITVKSLTINQDATVITTKAVNAEVANDVTVTIKANAEDTGKKVIGTGKEVKLDPEETEKEDENFTYTGEKEITVEFGGDFTNPEVKAGEEAVKPAITKDGEVVDNVDVTEAGIYTLTYSKEGYKTLVIRVTVKEETILEAPADGATEFTIKLEEEEGLDIKYLAFGLMNEANSAQKVATLEDVKSHLKKEYGVDFKSENIKLDQTNKTLSITGQLLSTEDWNKVKEEGKKDEPYRITVLNKDKSNKLVKIAIYEDGKAVFHNTKNELIKK